MSELIVALDGPTAPDLVAALSREAGVQWFKIGPQAMASGRWDRLVNHARLGGKMFLDLKLADTADTCRAAVARFAESGVAAVSTFTEAATDAALRGAEGSPLLVWRVAWLTDERKGICDMPGAHGVICPVPITLLYPNITTICPGIRFSGEDGNGHVAASTPEAACWANVSFAVVGRPIWKATDPVIAARRYKDALSGVTATPAGKGEAA